MKFRPTITLVRDSFNHWSRHRASRMGAALSYYTIFSIIPLLTLIIMAIGPALDHTYLQDAIVNQAESFLGWRGAGLIQSILSGVTDISFNSVTIVISIATLIIGTLGVFYELKNAMDDLWDVDASSRKFRGWRYFFSARLLSLSMIPILGFLFVISLTFSAVLSYLASYSLTLAHLTFLFQAITLLFSFFVTTFLFAFIYRYLPHRKLPWKELLRGAFITAILFMLGRFLIDFYITKYAITSVFGAAGAFAVLLIWIYYSVQIFLFGASLTYMYSKRYGKLKIL